MIYNIIYTSDIHGNLIQYKKLFDRANKTKCNAIIIGGDIAPKDKEHRTIESQKEFLEKDLFPLIKNFKKNNKVKIFIMLGNDDFKANQSLFDKQKLFNSINNTTKNLYKDFKIIGYPYVPITPFRYKDWEKMDLNEENESLTRKGIVLEGIKSKGNNFLDFSFNLKNRKDTIEKDLIKIFKNLNPKRVILVSHAPPYNTSLDMLQNNEHVGSKAIKKIIKEKQPYLTLHGHIHETVTLSNKFIERIGETISITSGNDHLSKTLKIIELNLYEPKKAIRLTI